MAHTRSASEGYQRVTTRTVHTIEVSLSDEVIEAIQEGDQVELQLTSRAQNRTPAAIRLSYTTIYRLTRDV